MVEQYSVRIFHHFIPPYILSGTMFGATLEKNALKVSGKPSQVPAAEDW